MLKQVALAWALVVAAAAAATAQSGSSRGSAAQTPPPTQASSASPDGPVETRPATTTFLGDTGLWFVPTAEVLAHRQWSVSGYRRGTNFTQGFTNVGDFAGTFGVGVGGRAEIFGSFLFDTRIDRDLRPLFDASKSEVGGIVDRYPGMREYWSGDNVGDFYVGGKVNFWSEYHQRPAALALRGILKMPTGDDEAGVSTGQADFLFDFVASKELAPRVELSGYAGYEFLGEPDDFDSPGAAFRWGLGAGFPARGPLRGVFEFTGSVPNDDLALITGSPVTGVDGSLAPLASEIGSLTRMNLGLTWQRRNGFFLGAGLGWNWPTEDRDRFPTDEDAFGDFVDWQVRIGYHPGVRVYVPPPPPAPAPAPAPAPPANRPPTVTAACNPSTVEVGRSCTLTATAADPDGDMLTYRWMVPGGTLANPSERQTLWTAPQQEGSVPITVTVEDGKGGKASATVNVQVTRPPVKSYTFEDVYFDFDRYTLRPEATRVLDEAVAAMQQDQTLRIQVEGHTCNIGTAEYNLALGDRRASAVRDYLTSRGVPAGRMTTVSYGEERPGHDNAREETRRLNRRAALTVNLTR